MPVTKRAALYARQSKGDASVTQQLELAEKRALERGWTIVGRFSDRSISATTGERRPGYDAMMELVKAGGADVIVVRHYDRLYRQPKELEGLIDDTEGISVESVYGGGYDLGTADGRMQARVVGAFARGEAEKKSERAKLGNQRNAAAGKPRKASPRPFGWKEDRIHLEPAEAEAIREAARAVLGKGTLAGIRRDWSRRGLRPTQAPYAPLPELPWSRASIKDILLSPRIAGIVTYCGELIETAEAQWEPILPVETWRAVCAMLTSPSRAQARGVRTMLGGLAKCVCGNQIVSGRNTRGQAIYRCGPRTRGDRPGPHVVMRRDVTDSWVEFEVLQRLYADDAHTLVGPGTDVDVAALRDEAQAIRRNLDEMAADRALGLVTRAQLLAANERGSRRIAEIETELESAGRGDLFAPIIFAEDIRAAWNALTMDRKRALVGAMFEVVLHPVGRGRKIRSTPEVLNLAEMEKLVVVTDRQAA